jgi:hypothetical protein
MSHQNIENYYDPLDIDIKVVVAPNDTKVLPECLVTVNGSVLYDGILDKVQELQLKVDLLIPISIKVELKNKKYDEESRDNGVDIQLLMIDELNLIPDFAYLAEYKNDHNYQKPTSMLPFNGVWSITTDNRPFYQWHHIIHKQGWLLEP